MRHGWAEIWKCKCYNSLNGWGALTRGRKSWPNMTRNLKIRDKWSKDRCPLVNSSGFIHFTIRDTTRLQGNCWATYGWETSWKNEKAILGMEQENKEKSKKGLLSLHLLETAFKTSFRGSSAERQGQKTWIKLSNDLGFSPRCSFTYLLKRLWHCYHMGSDSQIPPMITWLNVPKINLCSTQVP